MGHFSNVLRMHTSLHRGYFSKLGFNEVKFPYSMKYILAILFLFSACAPSADNGAEMEDSSVSERQDSVSDSLGMGYDSIQQFNPLELPELEECRTMLLAQEGMLAVEPTRFASDYANITEIPCGSAPGTGAYGYPMSLVVQWSEVENSPEGFMPQLIAPIVFHERDQDGSFVPVGYVTQAIPYWDEDDLSKGYVHLLYKYAGAGQCGMLITYSSEAWRAPFQFSEARERTCEAPPCEDDSCYEPMSWDLVFSMWE